MADWQNIATAPRDGTRILVACEWGVLTAEYFERMWWAGHDCYGNDLAVDPTHWMPPPPLPKDTTTE